MMMKRPLSDADNEALDRRSVTSLVIVMAVIIFAFVLVDTTVHRALSPEEPEFWIESAAVCGLKVTDSEFSATWNMTLLAKNPNKKLAINFDKVQVAVYYGSKEDFFHRDHDQYAIAKTQLSPFFLFTGNQTGLNFKLGVVGASFLDSTAKEIYQGKAVRGSVKFGVMLGVDYRYRTKVLDMGSTNIIQLYCDQLEFLFSPNTNDTGILTHQLRCDMY
ncbi:hypothetical protein M0R45_029640 [Rubus argutus]|uniref:Late embryogenesis abundant protein LEA-2 subgroup domain-containing protein n=1 Tax=Rubus argutus TaxID=59490 RepID=A0AAW1W8L6_RUBAR